MSTVKNIPDSYTINVPTMAVSGNLTLNGLFGEPLTTQTSTSPGTAGQICWDANYIYICTATNTWKRVALTAGVF
jgi:hypothetical protein